MTKVIIISGGNLDSYYEQVQQYLHAKYHNYPSNLPPMSTSLRAAAAKGHGHISVRGDEYLGDGAGVTADNIGYKVV
jgi:hypothetical protein